jgi:uncharacterized protein (TIGR00730 family)
VYGGGAVGLMGTVADAAMAAAAKWSGSSRKPDERRNRPQGPDRLEVVDGMHARKARMAELSDAFIALPGGLGTLEELFEVWTWGQLGYHAKPLGLLDVNGFYEKLGGFLDHIVEEGFVRPQHRAMLQLAQQPDELLDGMDRFESPVAPKWVDKKPD